MADTKGQGVLSANSENLATKESKKAKLEVSNSKNSLQRSDTAPIQQIPLNPNAKEFVPRSFSTSTKESYHLKKKEYLNMPIEEKRNHYICKKYTPLSDISSWEKYVVDNKYLLTSRYPCNKEKNIKEFNGKDYNVDKEINDRVSILQSDITTLEVDAIVNAANENLFPGGGVCGAIYRGAGRMLLEETKDIKYCKTGDAVLSGGYTLPAKYVVHAVGPVGEKEDQLTSCYRRIIEVSVENNIKTIAIPCISTGIFGYPNQNAAIVAMKTIREMLEKHKDSIDMVIFVLFMDNDVKIYHTYMQYFFPV